MKHLSKALVALSLFAASSAVHAQVSLYGTDFNQSTTYPFTDGTPYGGAGFPDLNGVGGWTATPTYADTTFDESGTNIVGQVYSGGGSSSASHGLNSLAFGGGYVFSTDFMIRDNAVVQGDPSGAGNNFSFTLLTTALTPAITVTFVHQESGGAEAAFLPQLYIGGVLQANAATGPVVDQTYHLTITVSRTGDVVASLGTPQSTLTGSDPLALADVSGFSVSEDDVVGSAANDVVNFDNISLTVPEPSTYATMGLGLIGMLGMMKFRRAKV